MTETENKYDKFVSQDIQILKQSKFKELLIELSKKIANNGIITQKSCHIMEE